MIAANAWMNNPTGFRMENGRVVDADPVGAMFGPSTWPQFVHMLIAAYMVTGYLVASVYAVGMLRGRRDRYHRFGLLIPLTFATVATPIQLVVGDWIADYRRREPAGEAGRDGGALRHGPWGAALARRHLPERPAAVGAGDPLGAVARW